MINRLSRCNARLFLSLLYFDQHLCLDIMFVLVFSLGYVCRARALNEAGLLRVVPQTWARASWNIIALLFTTTYSSKEAPSRSRRSAGVSLVVIVLGQ